MQTNYTEDLFLVINHFATLSELTPFMHNTNVVAGFFKINLNVRHPTRHEEPISS
jgi:hypothetical protein